MLLLLINVIITIMIIIIIIINYYYYFYYYYTLNFINILNYYLPFTYGKTAFISFSGDDLYIKRFSFLSNLVSHTIMRYI